MTTNIHRTLIVVASGGNPGTEEIARLAGLSLSQARKCIRDHLRLKRIASVSVTMRPAKYAITEQGLNFLKPPPSPKNESMVKRAISIQPKSVWDYADRFAGVDNPTNRSIIHPSTTTPPTHFPEAICQ
jgi:hypothetical protein